MLDIDTMQSVTMKLEIPDEDYTNSMEFLQLDLDVIDTRTFNEMICANVCAKSV